MPVIASNMLEPEKVRQYYGEGRKAAQDGRDIKDNPYPFIGAAYGPDWWWTKGFLGEDVSRYWQFRNK